MTKHDLQTKFKTKSFLFTFITLMLCAILCFAIACSTSSETEYSENNYSRTDTAIITNGSFEYGSDESTATDSTTTIEYPVSSVTGWTNAADNSAPSSITSGVISTASSKWSEDFCTKDEQGKITSLDKLFSEYLDGTTTTVVTKLGATDYLKAYLAAKCYIPNEDNTASVLATSANIKTLIASKSEGKETSDVTTTEINRFYSALLQMPKTNEGDFQYYVGLGYTNPNTHYTEDTTKPETLTKKVMMLNNFYTNASMSTATKATSSTTVTLEKGKTAKISVWVKTNLINANLDNLGGANIRIINKFNSTTQKEFGIYGIDTSKVTENNGWANYIIYVKADDNYDTTVDVVLGLGLGNGSTDAGQDFVTGSAYFDDVTIVKDCKDDISSLTATYMDFNLKNTHDNLINNNGLTTFVYDMTFDSAFTYAKEKYSELTNTLYQTVDFNDVTIISQQTKVFGSATTDATHTVENNKLTLSSAKNGTTNVASGLKVTITSDKFVVAPKSFALITLNLSDYNLGELAVNGVTVQATDIAVKDGQTYTRDNLEVTTITSKSTIYFVVDNNFTSDNYTRSFAINLFLGPVNVENDSEIVDYATGSVTFDKMTITTGETSATTDSTTDLYQYYAILASKSSTTIALYAERSSDYSDSSSYSFKVDGTQTGLIYSKPTAVNAWKGVTLNSIYINTKGTDKTIDTNNNAGVINSQYIQNYIDDGYVSNYVKTALKDELDTETKTGTHVQPLMIYTPDGTTNAYGYVSETQTISADAYASVTVKVKTTGNSTASIYLIDPTSSDDAGYKKVITFNDIYQNTNGVDYTTSDKKQNCVLSYENIKTDGEWQTYTFYIGAGKNSIDFQVELWSGTRTGSKVTGSEESYVFFDTYTATTSSAFTEPELNTAFSDSSSVIFNMENDKTIIFKRNLTETEKAFNVEYPAKAVSYNAKVVYVDYNNFATTTNNQKAVKYVVLNTLDDYKTDTNPYDSLDPVAGCTGCSCDSITMEPATFWLQFSTIAMVVALIIAIIALVIKFRLRSRRAHKNDAKSHFTVKSRYNAKNVKEAKADKKKAKVVKGPSTVENSEDTNETNETNEQVETSETTNVEEKKETLDEYVYGEVNDFGADAVAENPEAPVDAPAIETPVVEEKPVETPVDEKPAETVEQPKAEEPKAEENKDENK